MSFNHLYRTVKASNAVRLTDHIAEKLDTIELALDDAGATLLLETGVRPTGFLTPFIRSTVAIAGPTLKKSTRTNEGARP